jgi:hypothetical protein
MIATVAACSAGYDSVPSLAQCSFIAAAAIAAALLAVESPPVLGASQKTRPGVG